MPQVESSRQRIASAQEVLRGSPGLPYDPPEQLDYANSGRQMHDGSNWAVVLGVLVLLGIAIYLLPVSIAASRSHPNTMAIAALNILLGWTMLGWIASLVWALTAVDKLSAASAGPVPPGARVKPCPFCAEPVLAAAIKCRHCRSAILASATQPGQADLQHDRPVNTGQHRTGAPSTAIAASVVAGIVLVGWMVFRQTSGGQAGAASSSADQRSDAPSSATIGASAATPAASSSQITEGESKPTFDCAKARSAAERLICEDRQLSGLDVQLAKLYAAAKASTTDGVEFKRATSAAWADRERRCADKQCLLDWYAYRNAALLAQMSDAQALQTAVATPLGIKESAPGVFVGVLNAGTFDNCCIDGRSTPTPFWSIHLLRPIVFVGPDFDPAQMLDVQLGGLRDDSPGAGSKGRAVAVQCSSVEEGVTGHYAERAYCADAKVVSP